jgi:hypothetical protein
VEDEKLKSVVADAYQYVLDYQVQPQNKFDMVFMDINYEEANLQLSPPKKFLEQSFLAKLLVTFNDFIPDYNDNGVLTVISLTFPRPPGQA